MATLESSTVVDLLESQNAGKSHSCEYSVTDISTYAVGVQITNDISNIFNILIGATLAIFARLLIG